MADPIKVIVDDSGFVWVTLKGRDGRPVTGYMTPEDAHALGGKLTIAIEHFRPCPNIALTNHWASQCCLDLSLVALVRNTKAAGEPIGIAGR